MCNKFSNRNTEQFISVVRSFRNLTKSLGGCWIADHPDNNKWIEIMWSNRATLVIIHPNRSNRASLTLLSPKQESVHKLLLFNLSIDMTNQCAPAELFVPWTQVLSPYVSNANLPPLLLIWVLKLPQGWLSNFGQTSGKLCEKFCAEGGFPTLPEASLV